MTLQDVNNDKQDRAGAQASSRWRQPSDRRPKKDQEQARRLAAITELMQQARANDDSLTGPSGLLKDLTKMVLEVSLEEEMTEHLGHHKHQPTMPVPTRTSCPTDAFILSVDAIAALDPAEAPRFFDFTNHTTDDGTARRAILQ